MTTSVNSTPAIFENINKIRRTKDNETLWEAFTGMLLLPKKGVTMDLWRMSDKATMNTLAVGYVVKHWNDTTKSYDILTKDKFLTSKRSQDEYVQKGFDIISGQFNK